MPVSRPKPAAAAAGAEPMKCFKCNGEGHMARDCPVAAAAATAKLLEQQKKQWEQMQQQQQQAREQSQGNAPKPDVDYYKKFGLEFGATDEEIKKRHKELALKLHPDKNTDDPDAQQKFQEMQTVYQFLTDPEHKANIDAWASEEIKKQKQAFDMERKRKQREWDEMEADRAVKFRACLYYCAEEGCFAKSLEPIQKRPKNVYESVASMKQRFEDNNKDVE